MKDRNEAARDKLKAIREAACVYPKMDENGKPNVCGKKQMMTVSVPGLVELESGEVKSEDFAIGMPFCEYHCFMVMGGFVGVVMRDGKPHHFHGGLDTIAIVEHVLNVQAMTGRLKATMEQSEKAKAEAQAMIKKDAEAHKK